MNCADLNHTESVGRRMGFDGRYRFDVCLVGSFHGAVTYTERQLRLDPYLLVSLRQDSCSGQKAKRRKTVKKDGLLSSKAALRVHYQLFLPRSHSPAPSLLLLTKFSPHYPSVSTIRFTGEIQITRTSRHSEPQISTNCPRGCSPAFSQS